MPEVIFNPLIVYWHVVDLPQVKEALNEIPCDKLQIAYYDYPFPQHTATQYFLDHPQYTHMIIIPNDLVYNLKNFKMTKEFTEQSNYPITCGLCNVDMDRYKDFWNVCSWKMPELAYDQRRYRWLAESTRKELLRRGTRYMQVKFAGFPAMCIRRDIFLYIGLGKFRKEIKTDELPIWESRGGFGSDLQFCHNVDAINQVIICDLENTMLHLRFQGEHQNGKKEPFVKLITGAESIN